jgi:hypothetical protein
MNARTSALKDGWARACVAACAALLLAGCAAPVSHVGSAVDGSPWAAQSGPRAAPSDGAWHHFRLPGKRATQFHYAREEGRDAIAVTSASAASMLRHDVRIEPAELGQIVFSWKVPQLIAGADMASRDADDSPVRVVLVFDGDRRRFSPRDAMLAELTRALTGEEMPYATLMYVWCNRTPAGTVITNPRTSRVRGLVLESGPAKLNRWLDYERNVRADYEHAFGEPPGALIGVAIMTDTDNTSSTAQAWYGPLRLRTGHALAK